MSHWKLGVIIGPLLFLAAYWYLESGSWPPRGVIEQTVHGDCTIYAFAGWLVALLLAVGVAAMILGLFLLRRFEYAPWYLIVLGAVVLVIAAPGMYRERIIVYDDHFERHGGILWDFTVDGVRFDELQEIRYQSHQTEGRRSHTQHDLVCLKKDASMRKVPVGDLMSHAVAEIL